MGGQADGNLSEAEEALQESFWQKEQDDARRHWEMLTILIHAEHRPLTYTERYMLANELGITSMFKQVTEQEKPRAKDK